MRGQGCFGVVHDKIITKQSSKLYLRLNELLFNKYMKRLAQNPLAASKGKAKQQTFQRFKSVDDHPNTIQRSLGVSSITSKVDSLSKDIKEKVEQEIQIMLRRISVIAQIQRKNRKDLMGYTCSSLIFREIGTIDAQIIDQLVREYASNRLDLLESELERKKQQLQSLREEVQSEREFGEVRLRNDSIFIPQTGDPIFHLYSQAKQLKFQNFLYLYKKLQKSSNSLLLLENPKINSPKPQSKISMKKLNTNQVKESMYDYLDPLLQTLSEGDKKHFLKLLKKELSCSQPCCRWQKEQTAPESPAQRLLTSEAVLSKRQAIYSTEKYKNYQSRYLGNNFKLANVVSMTRTRTEEMDRIYTKFKSRRRGKVQQHLRTSSVV